MDTGLCSRACAEPPKGKEEGNWEDAAGTAEVPAGHAGSVVSRARTGEGSCQDKSCQQPHGCCLNLELPCGPVEGLASGSHLRGGKADPSSGNHLFLCYPVRLCYVPRGQEAFAAISLHSHTQQTPGVKLDLASPRRAAPFPFSPLQAGRPQQPHSPVCCLSRPSPGELPSQAAGQHQGRAAAPARRESTAKLCAGSWGFSRAVGCQ